MKKTNDEGQRYTTLTFREQDVGKVIELLRDNKVYYHRGIYQTFELAESKINNDNDDHYDKDTLRVIIFFNWAHENKGRIEKLSINEIKEETGVPVSVLKKYLKYVL